MSFESLYEPEELVELETEEELRAWVEALPCCTENKKGTKTGDLRQDLPLRAVIFISNEAVSFADTEYLKWVTADDTE